MDAYARDVARSRADKDRYLGSSPDSPLQGGDFAGLSYYPVSALYRLRASLELFAEPETVRLETSRAEAQPYLRAGRAVFTLAGQTCTLTLYRPTFATPNERFFIPFRDATSGKETYGAGRYLEAESQAAGHVLLDFNTCYHPYCAYSPRYLCPLPPSENWLMVSVHAGEKL